MSDLVLGATAHIVTTIYQTVDQVKVCRQQCKDLSNRCMTLLLTLRDSPKSMEGTKAMEFTDEVDATITRIHTRVKEWAGLGLLDSVLQSNKIKEGIDRFHRDIDACMMKFNISINMELHRGQRDIMTIQERDRVEFREMLLTLITTENILKSPGAAVEGIMQSLQTELHDPSLESTQVQKRFQQALWNLHKGTSMLPPMMDLTGQVTRTDNHPMENGTFYDIYLGKWLDKEKVALRLPRGLGNDPVVKVRFENEVRVWRALRHPNCTPLYGIVTFGEEMYSVSPWMENGNALTYIQTHSEVDRLRLLSEVASGMEYLHLNKIVHGDLRAVNVLISQNGQALLSDFGFAKFLEEVTHRVSLPSQTTSTYGDVWNFGLLCLELMTGDHSAPRGANSARHLGNGKLPSRPDPCPGLDDDLWVLICQCWDANLEVRPSMTEIKSKMERLVASSSTGQVVKPIITESPPASPIGDRPASSNHRSSIFSLRPSTARSVHSLATPSPRPSRFGRFRLSLPHIGSQSPEGAALGRSADNTRLSAASRLTNLGLTSTSLSSNSGPQSTEPSTLATSDTARHIRRSDGSVQEGTLEDLVEILTTGSDIRKDKEYRNIFLISHTAFTTSEALLISLVRRFHEIGSNTNLHAEYRTRVRHNIITVMKDWLASPQIRADTNVLSQMQEFALSVKSSKTMSELANQLVQMIELRMSSNQDSYTPPLTPSPSEGIHVHRPKDICPKDLAIALTTLEGGRYNQILPADYISHLQNPSDADNVSAAFMTNNRIIFWVKKSILHPGQLEGRAEAFKFFVNTALECRKLRNFHSMVAIITALHSPSIQRLTMTRKEVADKAKGLMALFLDMEQLLRQDQGYRRYRDALKQSNASCIPWINVHLVELRSVLRAVVGVGGQRLINFAQCMEFSAQMKELLDYKSANHTSREVGPFAYLESQLEDLSITEDSLENRSHLLATEEKRINDLRLREFRSLGFA